MTSASATGAAAKPNEDFRTIFFPVVLVRTEAGEARVIECLGTAAFFRPGLLVTCWHCVSDIPPPGHFYAVRVTQEDGTFRAYTLKNIERDANGTDLATAHCNVPGAQPLWLSDTPPFLGENVWTVGYPFPQKSTNQDGNLQIEISGRLLKSYISQSIHYNHPTHGNTSVYELGTAAPEGMSGCALLRERSLEVVGIIFASREVYTIDEFAKVDPETGKTEPEVRRVISMGLAYDWDVLRALTTSATGNFPLEIYALQQQGRKPVGAQ